MISSIGVVDQKSNQCFLFDATPDIKDQLNILQKNQYDLAGVILTHAHMGHYTGLMHFGREAMGAKKVPVFAMPKMQTMLSKCHRDWRDLAKPLWATVRKLLYGDVVSTMRTVNKLSKMVPSCSHIDFGSTDTCQTSNAKDYL